MRKKSQGCVHDGRRREGAVEREKEEGEGEREGGKKERERLTAIDGWKEGGKVEDFLHWK